MSLSHAVVGISLSRFAPLSSVCLRWALLQPHFSHAVPAWPPGMDPFQKRDYDHIECGLGCRLPSMWAVPLRSASRCQDIHNRGLTLTASRSHLLSQPLPSNCQLGDLDAEPPRGERWGVVASHLLVPQMSPQKEQRHPPRQRQTAKQMPLKQRSPSRSARGESMSPTSPPRRGSRGFADESTTEEAVTSTAIRAHPMDGASNAGQGRRQTWEPRHIWAWRLERACDRLALPASGCGNAQLHAPTGPGFGFSIWSPAWVAKALGLALHELTFEGPLDDLIPLRQDPLRFAGRLGPPRYCSQVLHTHQKQHSRHDRVALGADLELRRVVWRFWESRSPWSTVATSASYTT